MPDLTTIELGIQDVDLGSKSNSCCRMMGRVDRDVNRFNVRLVGWYLLLLAEFGLRLGPNRRGTAVPSHLFPDQRRELVKVGPTPVAVVILQKGKEHPQSPVPQQSQV